MLACDGRSPPRPGRMGSPKTVQGDAAAHPAAPAASRCGGARSRVPWPQRNTRVRTEALSMISWREKQRGLIAPDERLPWPSTIAMGVQHVLAMFGATVVAPLVMGFDPNLAIFFSGIGTLIFFVVVGGRVPSYLGSSFAFIGPVAAVAGSTAAGTFNAADIPKALGGIV